MFNDLLLNYSLYTVVIKYFVFILCTPKHTAHESIMTFTFYEQQILTKKSYL